MQLTFLQCRRETADIWSFFFKPPPDCAWIAGQSIRLEVMGAYSIVERRFTIASAPYSDVIMITTRLSQSDFKQGLLALRSGDSVRAHGIEGAFTWQPHHYSPIFVAAGIGITPFHAMVSQRAHDGLPLAATLLYAGGDAELPFAGTFTALAVAHPEFTTYVLPGQRITAPSVLAMSDDIQRRHVFLSGPSAMVDEVGAGLIAHGFPEENLVRDWFTGRLSRDG